MDQDNQKNLLLAIVLSVGVLLIWQVFYAGPKLKEDQAAAGADVAVLVCSALPPEVRHMELVGGVCAPAPPVPSSRTASPLGPSR